MNNADKFVEFEVNYVTLDGVNTFVSGRNYERDIFLSDVFRWIYRVTVHKMAEHKYSYEYSNERAISLQVEDVEFAHRTTDKQGNKLDVLGHGSTGRLRLTGSGGNKLMPFGESPLSYDLLRIERLMLGPMITATEAPTPAV